MRPSALNGFTGQTFPTQPADFSRPSRNLYTLSASTTIRPNLINEFHVGVNRFMAKYETPFSPGGDSVLPHLGGQPFYFTFATVTNTYSAQNAPQGRHSPIYQYSDTVTWLKRRHAIKAGAGVMFDRSNGFNSFNVIPGVTTGSGSVVPYANINTIPGSAQT